jgi:hypothetical protein
MGRINGRRTAIIFACLGGILAALASCVGDPAPTIFGIESEGGAGEGGGGNTDGGGLAHPDGSISEDGSVVTMTDGATGDSGDAAKTTDQGPGGVTGVAFWFSGDTNVKTVDGGADLATWTSRAGAPIVLTPVLNAPAPSTSTINGKASLYFAGKNGGQTCPCTGLLGVLPVQMPQPFTVFAVFRASRFNDATYLYDAVLFADSQKSAAVSISNDPGPSVAWSMSAGTKLETIHQGAADFILPHMLTAEFNGASSLLRLDGKDGGTSSGEAGAGQLKASLVVGTDNSPLGTFQGDLGELLVFGRILTKADRDLVEAALIAKWSL